MERDDYETSSRSDIDLFFDALCDSVGALSEFNQNRLTENFLDYLNNRIEWVIRTFHLEEEKEKALRAMFDRFDELATEYHEQRLSNEELYTPLDVSRDRQGKVTLTYFSLDREPVEMNMNPGTANQLLHPLNSPTRNFNIFGGTLRIEVSRLELLFTQYEDSAGTFHIPLTTNMRQELISALQSPRLREDE